MSKIGGLAAALALLACTTSAAPATAEQSAPRTVGQVQQISIQTDMLTELRPYLATLKASDAELIREGYAACASLLFRDKNEYRDAVLRDYPDVNLAVDHLTVAAAAKKYLCP